MKEKEFKFYILNLPIRNNKNENITLYSDFFEYIFNRKKSIDIGVDKAAIIRTMNKVDDNNKLYWGYITSFTKVGTDWLNIDTMDKEEYQIPKNLFANPKESYYFYIPKFHRIIIMKTNGGITLANTERYFLGLKKAIVKKYDFDVHPEVSSDAIDMILKADIVKSLTIDFSYSNADIGDDAFDFVDSEMKNSNTNSLKIFAKSNSPEGIVISESTILQGSIGISQSYGNAQALIIEGGKRKTVKTHDHPFIMKVNSSIADFGSFYNKVFDTLNKYLTRKK